MASPAKQRPRLRSALTVVIESIGAVVQLLLVFIGVWYLITDDGEAAENLRLLTWSVIATVYLASTVIWLNIDLRFHNEDHPLLKRASASTVVRVFSTVVTFTSSLVGLTAAADLILTRAVSGQIAAYELIAVWAMLASWALFHWGYARIYYSRYHRDEADRPLRFVATEHPRLIDFVYFSYTNGTSFAPSDVSVATSRMRWTVVWHTTFSFFFNALIIVLTMNTISGGFGSI